MCAPCVMSEPRTVGAGGRVGLKVSKVAVLTPISMDGRGCGRDNVIVERLWRSLKYEEIYLHGYGFASRKSFTIGTMMDMRCINVT